jgi:hypothetical protein
VGLKQASLIFTIKFILNLNMNLLQNGHEKEIRRYDEDIKVYVSSSDIRTKMLFSLLHFNRLRPIMQ